MTCRHSKGDPNCSSTPGGYAQQRQAAYRDEQTQENARKEVDAAQSRVDELLSRTPNPEQYEIMRHLQVGPHLVLSVQYSSCPGCSFDSRKVMVFLDVGAAEALYWRSIDPHFDEGGSPSRSIAPPPRARFPADDEGWSDAVAYAEAKGVAR